MPRLFLPNIAAGVIPKDVITRPLTSCLGVQTVNCC